MTTEQNTAEMSSRHCGRCLSQLTRREAKLMNVCQPCLEATGNRMQTTWLGPTHRHVGVLCQRDGVVNFAADCAVSCR